MSDSDDSTTIEITRHHREIVEDVQRLVDKYLRILEWGVADVDDEKGARGLVIQALKVALAEVEGKQP